MKVARRNKRGRPLKTLKSPPVPETKDIRVAPADKMVRNYPRVCPICLTQTYSSVCGCGRVTVINKSFL